MPVLFLWVLHKRCTQYTNSAFCSKYAFYETAAAELAFTKYILVAHHAKDEQNDFICLYICILNINIYTGQTHINVVESKEHDRLLKEKAS